MMFSMMFDVLLVAVTEANGSGDRWGVKSTFVAIDRCLATAS